MTDNIDITDPALTTLGTRLECHRLDQNLTQAAVAQEAGVSKRTVERLESGASVQLTSLLRILRVLHLAENLDALIPEVPPSPLEQLKLRGKVRARASTPTADDHTTHRWQWGNTE